MDMRPYRGKFVYLYCRSGMHYGTLVDVQTRLVTLENEGERTVVDTAFVEAVKVKEEEEE